MTFFLMVPVALFARVVLARPNADHDVHAFSRSRSRQNPRPATNGLGKTFSKPFIMAISPRKSGNHAKSSDSRAAWENSNGNPFIMAITLFSGGAHAKTRDRLGEIPRVNGLSWRFPQEKRRLRQNRRPVWEKSNGKPFIMAIAKTSAIQLAKPLG